MLNKYPRRCDKCYKQVEPYQGTCEKVGAKWRVEHLDCNKVSTSTAAPVKMVIDGPPAWTDADWDRISGGQIKPLPPITSERRSGHFSMLNDYDEEFYLTTGMTQADYRDAVNPDEGDR